MHFLPCFLCGAKLEKRTDKNGKPYFVCNPCGIQLFVRREHGIKLLDTLLSNSAKNELPFKQRAEELAKIQALLTEINGTKRRSSVWNRKRDSYSQIKTKFALATY